MKGVSFVSDFDKMMKDTFDRIVPQTDDDSFVRSIIERADTMEKNDNKQNENVRKLVEITVPKVEKKRSKAPVIAGVAALTAAAAGLGFFAGGRFGFGGVEIKSEHGAGYSSLTSPVTTPAPDTVHLGEDSMASITTGVLSEPNVTSVLMQNPEGSDKAFNDLSYGVIPADAVYEFENCTCRITEYAFDGITLIMHYDVTTKKGGDFDRSDLETKIILSQLTPVMSSGKSDIEKIDGSTAHCAAQFYLYEPSAQIEFRLSTVSEDDTSEGDKDKNLFTVSCPDMSYMLALNGAASTVSYSKSSSVYVTPMSFLVSYPGKGSDEADEGDGTVPSHVPEVAIVLFDGTTAFINEKSIESTFGLNFGYVSGTFLDKLDTREIKKITVDGHTVIDHKSSEDGIYDASDTGVLPSPSDPSLFRFVDYDVRIGHFEFDGTTFSASYDVIYPNGIPEDEPEPRVLICLSDQILSPDRSIPGAESFVGIARDSNTVHYTYTFRYSAPNDFVNIRFYDVTHFVYSDDIPYDYTYSTEIGVSGPNPMFTTSLAVTSAYLEEPVAYSDSVGVDMGQFGLEGVRYEDLTVSDHCAILHFTCPVSYDIAGNLTVSVTDFEHNTYIVSDSNMSVDDIDGITEVTVFSDALTFTDMKTISVNGMEIKMSELGVVPEHEIHASPAVTVVTTVTAEPDEPIIE